MAEIFISYKGGRRAAAEHFAEVLRRYGYSVWFDYELVKGNDFAAQVERQIREAKALVALWCTLSVGSRRVREEVHLAHDLGILVPVKIEACEIPSGFLLADTIDLSAWDGAPRSTALDPLIDVLEKRIGRDAVLNRKALIECEANWRRFGAHPLKDFALNTKLAQAETRSFGPDEGNGPDNGLLQRSKEERERAEAARRAAEEAARLAAQQAKEKRRREEEEERRNRVSAALITARAGPKRVLPGAGKTEWFKDFGIAPEMVIVPAGSFMMGSPAGILGFGGEPERENDEGPQHKVTIAKPFAIGRFAVTFAEWDAAQEDNDWQRIAGRSPRRPKDEGCGRGDRPVIDVCWDDAKAYLKWLSAKTNKDYRLPSEAEWEYACRADTTAPFWWGASITPEQANYNGNVEPYKGGGRKGEYRQKTLPVKSFEPNPWGVYQVHGNVWEWCEDLWHDNYNGAPQDGSAWTAGDSTLRVLRGGSWSDDPRALRSAYRTYYGLRNRSRFRGFRVVRTLAP